MANYLPWYVAEGSAEVSYIQLSVQYRFCTIYLLPKSFSVVFFFLVLIYCTTIHTKDNLKLVIFCHFVLQDGAFRE